MSSRNERLDILRLILGRAAVGSQEELLQVLRAEGYPVTQATLSRDLQKLKAAKVSSEEGYRYVLPEHPAYVRQIAPSLHTPEFLRTSGFLSMEFSGNLVVMRTRPGYATSITTEIDAHNPESLCGTIAGDDTILAVIREGFERSRVVEELAMILPAVRGRM
ncbi:MAG: arginine repressor [Prevotellaceae bacterium]|nr:arginine repressor [Prevotellaceae bacterium]